MTTSVILELDVGLGTVGKEIGVVRVHIESLRVKIHSEVEFVIQEGILGPVL